MALITFQTIITSVSLFHLTLGYFFIVNPAAIDNQTLVYILGESMKLPYARGFDTQSPALAFLGVALGMIGFSDLMSLSMPEEIAAIYYWGMQAPLRFMFALCLIFYAYFTGSSSPLFYDQATLRAGGSPSYVASSWGGDGLKNRVFFTFCFLEMISWFWIWVTLREERDALVEKTRRETERLR